MGLSTPFGVLGLKNYVKGHTATALDYGVATGGTGSLATPPAGYSGLYFDSSLTLTVTASGLFDVVAFGGGGGAGYGNGFNRVSGGGGGAQYTQTTIYLAAGSYNVIIGAGGAGSASEPASLGSATSIGNTLGNFAVCGRGAGGASASTQGGSGGGNGGDANVGQAFTGSEPFAVATGFKGGNGAATAGAGGGGGAGGVGANAVSTNGGAGGAGVNTASWTGNSSNTIKAAGGGGGGRASGGAGGSSIGGAGGTTTCTAAAANTASGGGGSSGSGNLSMAAGGAGGSGIIYVRFKI